MALCIKYRRKNYNKWVALWDEWKPLDLWNKPWHFWRGNMRISSTFWQGIETNITLWSPLLNKLIHWKYRNMHLVIPYATGDTLEVIEGGLSKPLTDKE